MQIRRYGRSLTVRIRAKSFFFCVCVKILRFILKRCVYREKYKHVVNKSLERKIHNDAEINCVVKIRFYSFQQILCMLLCFCLLLVAHPKTWINLFWSTSAHCLESNLSSVCPAADLAVRAERRTCSTGVESPAGGCENRLSFWRLT